MVPVRALGLTRKMVRRGLGYLAMIAVFLLVQFVVCPNSSCLPGGWFGPLPTDTPVSEPVSATTSTRTTRTTMTTMTTASTTTPLRTTKTTTPTSTTPKPRAMQVYEWKQRIARYLHQHRKQCENDWSSRGPPTNGKPLCDCVPKQLTGWLNTSLAPVTLERVKKDNPEVLPGGRWKPRDCTARVRLAVVIPYRGRPVQLPILLKYLHLLLRHQLADYVIIVVEQNFPETFNKAALMNVGFLDAVNDHDADCVIFHDVDHIPEDDRHFYYCREHPLHLGAYHDRHNYRLIYGAIFGAATAFRTDQFRRVNGFSNRFFGWGGEDDEMLQRIKQARMKILRDPMAVAGYRSIRHSRDKGNKKNDRR